MPNDDDDYVGAGFWSFCDHMINYILEILSIKYFRSLYYFTCFDLVSLTNAYEIKSR